MKDLFSLPLYKEGFKKVRPMGIGFTVAMAVLSYLGTLIVNPTNGSGSRTVLAERFMVCSELLVLFVPVLTYAMFSYINDRAGADFYHAIPQKRRCVFVSFTAALLSWASLMVLAGVLAGYMGWELAEGLDVSFGVLCKSLAGCSTLCLTAAACTALAMMFTGTPVSSIFAAGILIWVPPFVALLFGRGVETLYFKQAQWHSVFNYIGFSQFIQIRLVSGAKGYNIDVGLLINVVLAAVLLVLACRAYEKRDSEWATRPVAGEPARRIIRGAIPFTLLAVGIYLITTGYIQAALVFLCVGFAAYFVYQILSTLSLKATLRSFTGFLCIALAAGAFVGAIHLTAYCLEVRVPKSADKVESISFYYEESPWALKPAEKAVLGESISDEEVVKAIIEDFDQQKEEYRYFYTLDIKIKLKSGGSLWRSLRVTKSYDELEAYVKASEELGKRAYPLPDIELTESENATLWESFCTEYEKLGYEGRRKTVSAADGTEGSIVYYVRYKDETVYGGGRELFYVYADLMPETYAMLNKKG